MGIGTSMGAYYDDAFHQAAAQWDSKYDNNVIDPDTGVDATANDKNVIEPSVKTEDFITPVANVTNTPGEILEGLEGTRVFPNGYSSRGGPTANMRRSANDNHSDLYNPRESNMIGNKATDGVTDSSWQSLNRLQTLSRELGDLKYNPDLTKRNLSEFENKRLNKLEGERKQLLQDWNLSQD